MSTNLDSLSTSSKTENIDTRCEAFRTLCRQYCDFAHRAGVTIPPFRDNSNRRFTDLPEPVQNAILDNLRDSISITERAIKTGVNIEKETRALTWWALLKLKLRPRSDLFSHLNDSDIIEIYDANNIQVFRTFNMFQCISYTLEELFTYQWFELFKRDQNVTDQLVSMATQLLNAETSDIIFPELPPHFIEDLFGPRRTCSEIQTRLGAPLYTPQNKVGGYLSATRLIRTYDRPARSAHFPKPTTLPHLV